MNRSTGTTTSVPTPTRAPNNYTLQEDALLMQLATAHKTTGGNGSRVNWNLVKKEFDAQTPSSTPRSMHSLEGRYKRIKKRTSKETEQTAVDTSPAQMTQRRECRPNCDCAIGG